MPSALAVYAEALARAGVAALRSRVSATARMRPLAIGRWVAGADAVDERALAGLRGPVLDVGCGPGPPPARARPPRRVRARRRPLPGRRRRWPADAAPTRSSARSSARSRTPARGQSALLLDGNIGIGGSPARLLRGSLALLAPGGTILVELAAPETDTIETLARIETPSSVSEWFAWAEVSAASIGELADRVGVRVSRRLV